MEIAIRDDDGAVMNVRFSFEVIVRTKIAGQPDYRLCNEQQISRRSILKIRNHPCESDAGLVRRGVLTRPNRNESALKLAPHRRSSPNG